MEPSDVKSKTSDYSDHQTLLNILLQNPEELNLKRKPSAIRENKLFTLDMREIPIESAKADDNGSYISRGSVTKFFVYNDQGSRTAHKNENGVWYINAKSSKGYNKVYVPESEIYGLTGMYHVSKNNRKFSRTIVTVKAESKSDINPFYVVIYQWSADADTDFVLPRHGNATKPVSGPYFRKDPHLFEEIDNMLDKGLSTNQVYSTMSKMETSTMSETVAGPKVIENRKEANRKQRESVCTTVTGRKEPSEPEMMIASLRSNSLMNSVTFTKEYYTTLNVLPNMLHDLYRFCVLGNGIFRVDTTFELVESLWLTDTTYTNEALVNLQGKHPEFPGPSFWHFRKNRECYRRFAGELIILKPELLGIKKVGHDLDKALSSGLTDIFQNATKLWCTQHLQERDAHQIRSMGANQLTQSRVMADIYGSQNEILLQSGLADAEDESDFDAKLESLKPIWQDLVPGFHHWFTSNRSVIFKECLVLSAREQCGIQGRFYTNGLELKHKLQKKRLKEEDIPKEVTAVTDTLQKWYEDYYVEECRALRGLGKYRISPGYDQFYVDPVKWNRWGPQRQTQHLQSFRNFVPNSYDKYTKPKSAGKKASPKSAKRRADMPEPELFVERIQEGSNSVLAPACKKTAVTPLRLSKAGNDSHWQVQVLFYIFLVFCRLELPHVYS